MTGKMANVTHSLWYESVQRKACNNRMPLCELYELMSSDIYHLKSKRCKRFGGNQLVVYGVSKEKLSLERKLDKTLNSVMGYVSLPNFNRTSQQYVKKNAF